MEDWMGWGEAIKKKFERFGPEECLVGLVIIGVATVVWAVIIIQTGNGILKDIRLFREQEHKFQMERLSLSAPIKVSK